jgi:hypothetical protein
MLREESLNGIDASEIVLVADLHEDVVAADLFKQIDPWMPRHPTTRERDPIVRKADHQCTPQRQTQA